MLFVPVMIVTVTVLPSLSEICCPKLICRMRPIRGACSELLVVRHLSRPSRQSMIQMCLLIFTGKS